MLKRLQQRLVSTNPQSTNSATDTQQTSVRKLKIWRWKCRYIYNSSSLRSVLVTSPSKRTENKTVKKGSIALIVWVKETFTLPKLTFVSKLPNVWAAASWTIAGNCRFRKRIGLSTESLSSLGFVGVIFWNTWEGAILGRGWSLRSHIIAIINVPHPNWNAVTVAGYG